MHSHSLHQCPSSTSASSYTYHTPSAENEAPVLKKDLLHSTFTTKLSSSPIPSLPLDSSTSLHSKSSHPSHYSTATKARVVGIHSNFPTPSATPGSTCIGGPDGGDTPRVAVMGLTRPANIRASSFPIRQRVSHNGVAVGEKAQEKKEEEAMGRDRFVDGLVGKLLKRIWVETETEESRRCLCFSY